MAWDESKAWRRGSNHQKLYQALLDDATQFFIFAFNRANPQPRQNHVHRQVRHPRIAQQRRRFFHPRGFERPVPRPEFIALDLQNFTQRIDQYRRPACAIFSLAPRRGKGRGEGFKIYFRRAPVFNV